MRFANHNDAFEVRKGIDGNWYAIFNDGYEAENACYSEMFYMRYYRIASFGKHCNALQLTDNGGN